MPRRTSAKIPAAATVIRNYAELHDEIDAFRHGERNLLIIIGPPGTAKSTAVKNRLVDPRIIEGGARPYRLYMELHEHKDKDIVLDDADKVWSNKDGVFLLKLVTQTQREKRLQWNSNTPEIRSGELPAEFTTTSRVLIVANSWPRHDPDIAAIESRGHLLYFAPSFTEMHAYAGTFFHHREVYEFIGQRLAYFDELDLRFYYKTIEKKATGERTERPDLWKEYVLSHMMSPEKRIALDLIKDTSYRTDNQRALEYARLTGQSSRTFFRHRNEILLRRPELAGGNECQGDKAG